MSATPAKGGKPAATAAAAPPKAAKAAAAPAEVASDLSITESVFDGPDFAKNEQQTAFSAIMLYAILGLICLISFAIRLFAVVRWESVIHEFDPWFNFRATKYLAEEGFYDFLNWQDDRTWHPIGRVVGGTVYPGLMVTAGALHYILNLLHITVNVRNMCVFLAPLFAANTALATYLLTSEVTGRTSSGLIAAAMVGIVPSYISRSVAGSYDNEGVAIFALVFTFYLWVKAVKTGGIAWAAAAALSYFYMVAAWGGYVFIINIIPIHAIVLIASGRYSSRLYVAYSLFYVLGSLLAMQVPFVGFNVVQQAESAASHGVFVMVQLWAVYHALRDRIKAETIQRYLIIVVIGVIGSAAALLITLQLLGYTQWTGRSLTLLDPTYAKKYIPIIASVSEHQPTSWTSFFFDLHVSVPFAPVGLFFLFQRLGSHDAAKPAVAGAPTAAEGDGRIFMIIYGTISWYFAGVMVRLMLTLAPAACMLGAIGISGLLNTMSGHLRGSINDALEGARNSALVVAVLGPKNATGAGPSASRRFPAALSLPILGGTFALLAFYTLHATYVSSEAYSSPSIVLASRRNDGSRVIMDDFREAYYWMRQNTADDAKIMSWWDYGYQMSGMANRTVFVDNNTWNNTHIATVGRAMASNEEDSYPIMHSLDVDYVLVIFGGLTGYQSDDINKFLWMVRIGGGVFPHIKESDYFADGQYRMDKGGAPTMLNSLMYKMCYYRFDEMTTQYGRPAGYDLARSIEQGHKRIQFEHLEEVFTSEHWIVRIYKRHAPPNRDGHVFDPVERDVDRFGRRQEALAASGKKARARRHLPLWAPGGSSASADAPEAKPAVRYVGCYRHETDFPADKVYGGSTTGAYIGLARAHAVATGKKYVAIARHGGDGHSFSFSGALAAPNAQGGGCDRPCLDDKDFSCGCSDTACSESPDPGHDNVRRWAVYEVLPDGAVPARAGARRAARGGSK